MPSTVVPGDSSNLPYYFSDYNFVITSSAVELPIVNDDFNKVSISGSYEDRIARFELEMRTTNAGKHYFTFFYQTTDDTRGNARMFGEFGFVPDPGSYVHILSVSRNPDIKFVFRMLQNGVVKYSDTATVDDLDVSVLCRFDNEFNNGSASFTFSALTPPPLPQYPQAYGAIVADSFLARAPESSANNGLVRVIGEGGGTLDEVSQLTSFPPRAIVLDP